MEKTLKILNKLEADGLIAKYAIGGAIAFLFYAEPVLTYDMDVFCLLPAAEAKLITLAPIYRYLKAKGYSEDKEHIIIEGLPVQFIPAYNDLIVEALTEAEETRFNKTPTKVVSPEYLVAILLQTDRPKDRARLPQLLDEADIDGRELATILKKHGLESKWQKFKRQNSDHD